VSLEGRHIIVTAGPTHEPIDPVRVIANRSSGRQGFAIARAAAEAGARVTLVSGPVSLPTPAGIERVDVETAIEMRDAVFAALPADASIMVAAVADWRVEPSAAKLKKSGGPPKLRFLANPDILAELAASGERPGLVVGFAAETSDVIENAISKQVTKGADWIVANDVTGEVMGGTRNRIHLVTSDGVEHWPEMSKDEVARRLLERVSKELR
jgi:phosphopantothenoylcysteine synthetase/decarboxylase